MEAGSDWKGGVYSALKKKLTGRLPWASPSIGSRSRAVFRRVVILKIAMLYNIGSRSSSLTAWVESPEHNKPPIKGGLKLAARYGAAVAFFTSPRPELDPT
jgi:hypothetical protein